MIKVNDRVIQLSEQNKELTKEMRDFNCRLIRAETFIEIAVKQHEWINTKE